MEVKVGTSGWLYDWNLGQSFDWYLENSGLNAVELNASFYRFPFPSQVRSWSKKGSSLRWAIKVNRFITHVFKLGPRALTTWRKFERLFKPMDELVDFYLFQLPPQLTPRSAPAIERFISAVKLGERFALEVRHQAWFKPEWIEWARGFGVTWVSVDSPDFPLEVYNTSGLVYERMHGRTAWYAHYYSDEELREVAEKIKAAKPRAVYVLFNNDHAMLENGRRMLKILGGTAYGKP